MNRKEFAYILIFLIALFLTLITLESIHAEEVPEKENFKEYETFDYVDLLSPEEGGTSKHEVPLYQIKNANIYHDGYEELYTRANEIVVEVNENIIPEYNKVHNIAKDLEEENKSIHQQRERYKTLAISEGIFIVVSATIGAVYLSVR